MALSGPPFPSREQPLDAGTGLFQPRLLTWFRDLRQQVDLNPARITRVSRATQSASISTTAIPSETLVDGLYQVLTFTRVVRAATTSSSLRVDMSGTDNSVSYTQQGTAITGNTTATTGRDLFFLRISGASPISYSTTYASVGGTTMAYDLEIVLMLIAAD